MPLLIHLKYRPTRGPSVATMTAKRGRIKLDRHIVSGRSKIGRGIQRCLSNEEPRSPTHAVGPSSLLECWRDKDLTQQVPSSGEEERNEQLCLELLARSFSVRQGRIHGFIGSSCGFPGRCMTRFKIYRVMRASRM
jgi:hypothetical protein